MLAVTLNTGGMLCLALGMERHYREIYRAAPGSNTLPHWRRKGWPLLALGLLACLGGWGAPIGIVIWAGLLSIALIGVAAGIAIRSRRK